jgi:hypothetical protein
MNVIEAVIFYRNSSCQSWEAAVATDDSSRDFETDWEACLGAYDEALEFLSGGDFNAAVLALQNAAYHERIGGDDSDARAAIQAVNNAWSNVLAYTMGGEEA